MTPEQHQAKDFHLWLSGGIAVIGIVCWSPLFAWPFILAGLIAAGATCNGIYLCKQLCYDLSRGFL